MKCSKCGYDYPAKETKCPYCGEPNKLGMEWEKEEDETRKETLLTKAKVLHSMPLYVANKIMNIILLLAVVLLHNLVLSEACPSHNQRLCGLSFLLFDLIHF